MVKSITMTKKKNITTKDAILRKLAEGTKDTAKQYYTEEQINHFADFYLDKWDENTSEDIVAESLMDFYYDDDSIPEIRRCSVCGKYFQEGYCQGGGEMYFCSDECLHTEFSDEEWKKECESDEQSYYTEWNK